jgi:3-mercaptopyruvate sulfurtransferase SseA
VLFLSSVYISTNLRTIAQAPQPLTSEEETFPEIPRVTLKDAFTAFQDGSAVFIDVRDADSYTNSHIPGAKSLPLTQLEDKLKKLGTETWIITYCT